jgi:hypothetical protein
MTFFPHNIVLHRPQNISSKLGSVRQQMSDVLWGRPLFKAPALRSPRVDANPQPFSVARVPQNPALG